MLIQFEKGNMFKDEEEFYSYTNKERAQFVLCIEEETLFYEEKKIDLFHLTVCNFLARQFLLNDNNEDLLYNNCGCDNDPLIHAYNNLLCMKIIILKIKEEVHFVLCNKF